VKHPWRDAAQLRFETDETFASLGAFAVVHLGLRLELLIDDQALRDGLPSQAVAGFAQAAEITSQRIDLIEQSGVDRLGQTALGLDRIWNAERADERIEPGHLRDIGNQLAQTKKRIALSCRHEIDTAHLAKRDCAHPVDDSSHHL
jgi:hypothetical protein